MGRSIYFTDKELAVLRSSASEWCEMMADGEETFDAVQETLNNGLGSALKKLYKGCNGERAYKDY